MGGLVERAAEFAALSGLLSAASTGSGGCALLTGPAGIGKTALVAHTADVARAAGFTVLSSSPTPLSTGLAHGVVRDWLAPRVRSLPPGTPPFDGPAAALAEALREAAPTHDVWNLASLDYALTWVLESLAEAHPLLLVVDDVQWADVGSLQLLDLLSARIGQTSAALLLALRTGERSVAPAVLDRFAARAQRLQPPPLSVAGVEQVRRTAPAAPTTAALPAHELHRLTGGIPFLVQEMLRSESRSGPPRGVVESVTERLHRLGPAAESVARTVAVLGEDADLDAVADLTGHSVAELVAVLEVLAEAGIVVVTTWRLRPAHQLVAEAIRSGMTVAERSTLHRAAADHLAALGRPDQAVASHLVHTLPQEDADVVELLRRAGEESLRAGAPDVAARQLRRAAEETRPETTDPELVALAAVAHLQAGLRTEARDLWAVALERSRDPEQQARMLTDMGHVQMTMGEGAAATAAYRRAVAMLSEAGYDASSPALRRVLVRMGLSQALYEGARAEILSAVSDTVRQPPDQDTHDDRLLFALASSDLAVRAVDRPRSLELARRALGAGALLAEETSEGFGFYVASGVLSWADAYEENRQVLEAAMEDARERGSVLGFATASYCRGLVELRTGHHVAALSDFQGAMDLRERGWTEYGVPAVSGTALSRLALGRPDEAAALEPALRAAAARGEYVTAQAIAVAGVVRAAHGDHEQALADYREAARLMGAHPDNPSIVEWRELSVWSLMALGRRDEAAELAETALELARSWGAPRALGFSLRTSAQVRDRDESCALLRQAERLSRDAGCVDLRARTATDLAVHLLAGDAAERAEAADLLRSVVDEGRRLDIPPLVTRASRLLVRAGFAVDDPRTQPVRRLTPGERRVAELAAAGATNREIAQKLFVTVKAVEWHLSNAYRKLGITSRRDLPARLYDGDGPTSSSAR